ncbi:MAG: hypothetical protein QOJ59_4792 [Thermomicrobiales bacterium]|jgi:uncharacterized protein GlcG (DUF336 family)|nr:hypothetical protein [Thermomicrobiales bacterium]
MDRDRTPSPAALSRRAALGLGAAVGAAAVLSRGTAAQDATPAAGGGPLATLDVSLAQAQAQAAVAAAVAKAAEIGTKMDIAVVDAGGNLKAFARMDGAWLGSIDIAIKKATTARFFDLPSEELGKLSQPGGPLYQIEVSNGGLITFPGGLPLHAADGTVIGGIGVSGSMDAREYRPSPTIAPLWRLLGRSMGIKDDRRSGAPGVFQKAGPSSRRLRRVSKSAPIDC